MYFTLRSKSGKSLQDNIYLIQQLKVDSWFIFIPIYIQFSGLTFHASKLLCSKITRLKIELPKNRY